MELYGNVMSMLHGFHADVPLCGKTIRFYNFSGTQVEPLPLMQKHGYYEILFTLSGEASLIVESEEIQMKEGTILYLNRNVLHSNPFYKTERNLFLVLAFEVLEKSSIGGYSTAAMQQWTKEEDQLFSMVFRQPYILVHNARECLLSVQHLDKMMSGMHIGDYTIIQNRIGNLLIMILQALYAQVAVLPKAKMEIKTFASPVCQIYDYISTHYTEPLKLQDISEYLGYSPRHLQRLISYYYGVSLSELLTHLRLYKAQSLLLETELSVSKICELCGINNEVTLYRLFREEFGMTPKEYRNSKSPEPDE